MIPDAEKIVSDHLRTHPAVAALNTRIVGKTPDEDKRSSSWVRVLELDSPQVGQPDHLVEFMLQLDCYAGATGGQPEVKTLQRTIRAALADLPGSHGSDVVTGVKVLGGPRGTDDDFKPPRDRQILTALVWAHG